MNRLSLSALSVAAALALGGGVARAEEPAAPVTEEGKSTFMPLQLLQDVVDMLPDLLDNNLPGFDPKGSVRVYVRPHFGDFIHRDYVRVPIGARAKISGPWELNTEVESYFTHGLGDTSAGYGFSYARFGGKYETAVGPKKNIGLSTGVNYITPLSRPPLDISDAQRHTQPYVAFTLPLSARWGLLGYGNLGMDFLSHTGRPPNIGKNQLHTNSLGLSLGVTRGWKYFQTSLTGTVITSRVMSDENHEVYDLTPEVVIPLRMISGPRANILLKLTGHATSGPDGNDYGLGSSLRIELRLKHKPATSTTAPAK